MSWIAPGDDRHALLAQLPDIGDGFEALHASLWQLPHIPPEIIELCRLRLAQLHGSALDCALEKCRVEPTKRENLQHWPGHSAFSDAERACLEITEVHAMDARQITDAQSDAVKSHFGDVGLVALFQALGVIDGMIRLGLIWELANPGGERADG